MKMSRPGSDQHTTLLSDPAFTGEPSQEKYMKSVDIELMLSVEEEGLRERLELDSWPEIIRLVGQCSMLVGIVGIIVGLIAA
jgi:hypothetical protein